MPFFEISFLVFTAVALVWTKALDVISTWRFVGMHGESNPLALWLFEKAGLAGGPSKRVVRVLFQRNACHGGLLLSAASSLHPYPRHGRHF